jgi:glutamate--cysteine ligase
MHPPIPSLAFGTRTLAPPLDAGTASDYLRAHSKPAAQWRVGIEYELIGFTQNTLRRINKETVQTLLRMLVGSNGIPTIEDGSIIAVSMPFGDVTLEPGGQIEFSGLPELELAHSERALQQFITLLHACARELGTFFISFGFDPVCALHRQSWIHKRRYAIMRPYLKHRGARAWDMMTRTAAAQVSIDYGDQADLGRKYVLGNRIGPIVAAMFANSPFADGAPTGLKSNRYAVWLETDDDRTGPGPRSLAASFNLREYAESVLQVPVFFVERDGALVDVAGRRLDEVAGANVDDFAALLGMIFTEARVREYVELRSADSAGPDGALNLAAFWKGLTYEPCVLEEALELAPQLDPQAYRNLQRAVARDALAAKAEGVDVLVLAQQLVSLAVAGLSKIAPAELAFMNPLAHRVLVDGVSPADLLLEEYSRKSVEQIVREHAVA